LIKFNNKVFIIEIFKNKKKPVFDMDGEIFTFTQEHKKSLNAQEQTELIKAFKNYDKNGDGTMDCKEFKNIMIDLGHRKTTEEDAQKMLT